MSGSPTARRRKKFSSTTRQEHFRAHGRWPPPTPRPRASPSVPRAETICGLSIAEPKPSSTIAPEKRSAAAREPPRRHFLSRRAIPIHRESLIRPRSPSRPFHWPVPSLPAPVFSSAATSMAVEIQSPPCPSMACKRRLWTRQGTSSEPSPPAPAKTPSSSPPPTARAQLQLPPPTSPPRHACLRGHQLLLAQ